jgi:hypothetical protein
MARRQVTGWRLDPEDRARLLEQFAPRYADIIAEHVTLQFGGACALPRERSGEVIGEADDGAGAQALVVRIGGTSDRPDGSTYHITWSLDRNRGRKPVQSNDVIRDFGWRPLAEPVPITLHPARI